MTRKYFGTDGIRGRANTPPVTAEMALKVAMATAIVLREGRGHHKTNRVVIGKDTRLSCYMIEQAMAAGFGAMGMEVIFTGPIPTPGIAMLTRSLRADIGVMISASHNLYMDNGIKLFGADGYKLDDSFEMKIEEKLDQDLNLFLAPPDALGKSSRLDDVIGRYSEFLKQSFPKGLSLAGLKIVVDCANGAAYKVAPQILWELEAEVVALNVAPNGRNINADCGATDTKTLQKTVIDSKADIGIALDGDADRLIMVDEKGEKIDGDQLIAALALSLKARGLLRNNMVAATVMSNLGLERVLAKNGIKLERSAVGDRYVMEKMRNLDLSLGGEQSGHIIMSDFGTTGDGMLAALQILAVLKTGGKAASNVLHCFEAVPQILKNVRFESGRKTSASVMDDSAVRLALKQAEETLANDGRLLVRASGTEPVIRVMAEGDDRARIEAVVGKLCDVIEKAAQSACNV
jgi:phosphoglucosamine mutase